MIRVARHGRLARAAGATTRSARTRGSLLAWLDHDDVWDRESSSSRSTALRGLRARRSATRSTRSSTVARARRSRGRRCPETTTCSSGSSSTAASSRPRPWSFGARLRAPRGALRDTDFSFGDDYRSGSRSTRPATASSSTSHGQTPAPCRNESARLGRENYERASSGCSTSSSPTPERRRARSAGAPARLRPALGGCGRVGASAGTRLRARCLRACAVPRRPGRAPARLRTRAVTLGRMRSELAEILRRPGRRGRAVAGGRRNATARRSSAGSLRGDERAHVPDPGRDPALRRRSRTSARRRPQSSFGFKWTKRDSFGSEGMQDELHGWLLERYGFASADEMRAFFASRAADARRGLRRRLRDVRVDARGLERRPARSGSAPTSRTRSTSRASGSAAFGGTHFVQADVLELPFRPESFDAVFSEGVLHHTPSTERALKALVPLLAPGRRADVLRLRRKAPIREFTDDYVRERLAGLSPEEAWEALRPLTRLGAGARRARDRGRGAGGRRRCSGSRRAATTSSGSSTGTSRSCSGTPR